MGCASSREARRDRLTSSAPYTRSQSMPVHNARVFRKFGHGSNRHTVNLTSSTLGSLKLKDSVSDEESIMKSTNDNNRRKANEWSEMISKRIPKTPTKTPSHEPETINTWELMQGLEEAEAETKAGASPKPLWMQIDSGDSILSDFDPDIISNFRKALNELSPEHQILLQSPKPCIVLQQEPPKFEGIVKARVNAFQQKIDAKKGKKNHCPPNGERKVVLYFTSLRGIRKTYEDCFAVKVILHGYGVKVGERDVSMHSGFKDELNELGFGGGRLPKVFVNGEYLGGADEVRAMHEAGELGKALEECEKVVVGKGGGGGGGCEGCGDVRFVPCETCFGSCKIFVEEEEEEEGEGEGEVDEEEEVCGGGGGGIFRRCPDCNENGLIRCPFCY